MNLAAIDIGSNAMRLLIAEPRVIKNELEIKKISLVRVPLRLGETVFATGLVSLAKREMLRKSLIAYKNLMEVYQVQVYRAVATSAMREAKNGKDVLAYLERETGIHIDIISGRDEAEIVKETFASSALEAKRTYLYIDVGGGSTELSFIKDGKPIRSKSFKIGTVRVLQGLVDPKMWDELKDWVLLNTPKRGNLIALGSGGNINNLVKLLSNTLSPRNLSRAEIDAFYSEMKELNLKERQEKYGFKTDRADVIEPATKIYTKVMKWANIDTITVPKIGVADGIIAQLYKNL